MTEPGAGELYVIETGLRRGRKAVLVHGSMDRTSTFGRVARRLDDLFVVRYDRRGYGRSRHVPAAAGLHEHVEDLLTVIDGEACTVVGHSYGAIVAVEAALRHPELVNAVGAFEPPAPWEEWWPSDSPGAQARAAAAPGDAAEAFVAAMIGERRWNRLPARTRSDRRSEGPALLSDMASLSGGPPHDPADLRAPLVVGTGTESPEHLQRAARQLHAGVASSALVKIVGAQHGAHLSHPPEFAAFVRGVVEVGRVRL